MARTAWRVLASFPVAVACAASLAGGCNNTGDNYPVNPGGGGGGTGGGTKPDAAVLRDGGGDGGAEMISARACLLTDVRDLTSCASTGAADLTVTLGSQTATTADDGSFTIVRPLGSNLAWNITGSGIATSVMTYSPVVEIPVVDATTYADLLATNGVILTTGEGGVMARVLSAGVPVAGATATGMTNDGNVFYDGSSATVWNQGATGTRGTVWIPQMATGAGTISITPAGGSATTVTGVPVTDGGVSFVVVELP